MNIYELNEYCKKNDKSIFVNRQGQLCGFRDETYDLLGVHK